ncbi:LD-carboxypeptidase [Sphingomonas sp. SUN039]|uniref:LD-carboxypeptidase n=1 Tax=Sphingomonas sp. SUN039 TaxID=2937787 RepID=UPI00216475DD|nr:LD-carboxypeptidase [Sphingomonas sp. SUN039]UVO54970.1 LD-carboxypeptidase [Sphingomonas sp. SUN039]
MRIAVVAPSNTVSPQIPARIAALAADRYGDDAPEIVFHPQCFLSEGHFAGPDAAREDALVEVANDPAFDAVWFGRGGYGANRIAEAAVARMGDAARTKTFLGYSDGGFLLAGLLRNGIGKPVHAPMPSDIVRDGGEAAVVRTLDWLRAPVPAPHPQVAFNLTVLSNLLGTPLEPDLAGHVLMIEEVAEEMYRIDRTLFHVTSSANVRACAGIRLGRCAPIPDNVPDFGVDEVDVARHWCRVAGIAWLGRADIGHDAANTVVPFA